MPVAEDALTMKETHEEDDPHSDNLFCLENTVSNAMPAVWRSTMDFVAMNSSSCGMANCQGNTSYIWRASRKFLVCRVVKLLLVTVSPRISPVRSGSTPTPHSFLWRVTPSMNAGLRNRLLAVWRKAICCAAGVGYQDEVTSLLSEFRLTNIVDRWIVQFACYVRRCVKQEAPSTSCAKLQRPAHRHRTRGQENFFRPFLANNRAGLVSFSNRAPLLWNSLPVDVWEAPSPSSFKRRLLNILKEPSYLNKLSSICFNNPSIIQ